MCSELNHPVCNFSADLKPYQLNDFIIEKETLAVPLVLQHFEVYVGSGSFPVTVYTNHNLLVFLNQMYNNNQRLMHLARLWFRLGNKCLMTSQACQSGAVSQFRVSIIRSASFVFFEGSLKDPWVLRTEHL